MDGMSCLQTINYVVEKIGYLWLECPLCKHYVTWLKWCTYGWDVLFTNRESTGKIGY
jgi:hypothetical protein